MSLKQFTYLCVRNTYIYYVYVCATAFGDTHVYVIIIFMDTKRMMAFDKCHSS